jgi:O-antigen ligase
LWFRTNCLSLSVILVSLLVITFWHFQQTEWHPARRALSVGNRNDFSWRNRLAAWEGTLQMMAEKPWFGYGWNQPEPMYDRYYLPPRLTESAAIQMNDHLLLGATLGIPALFCFAVYIWLNLTRNAERETRSAALSSAVPLPITCHLPHLSLSTACRAGAIVLLVGFWFDGGLFKLPTASTFWILLALGCAGEKAESENQSGG